MKQFPLIFLSLIFSISLQAKVQVSNLRCEFVAQPMGIDIQNPRFAWNFVGKPSFYQGSYMLEIASDPKLLKNGKADVYVSEKTQSTSSF